MQNVKWGEFKINELFEKIKVKSLKYKTSELPGVQNQGLNNYVKRKNATILKNVISISANGANTGATFYQNKEFTVLQDAYAIKWVGTKDELSDNHYIFFTNAISKTIFGNYEWTNKAGWEKIKANKINLPTKNDKIDFAFMENFIAELEAERIKKLDNYLVVNGLKDYTLTDEEEKVLKDFDNIKWEEFKLGNLFDVHNTKGFNKDSLVSGNQYDYITRTSQNQGILQQTGFVNEENLNSSGNWSLGLLQMDFFYRHNPWYAGQFVRKITSKKTYNNKTILFLTTILNNQKNKFLNILVRDFDKTFLNQNVLLPTQSSNPHYHLMETLISAIQKLVIKDLVLYVDGKRNNKKNKPVKTS